MTAQQRMLGGLWGAIVGDALGVPVEFTSREERRRDPVTDMRGYGSHHQPPGTWSDDSSLLLCTVEALCEDAYRPERLAGLFLAWQEWGYWTPHGTVFDIGIATRAALSRMRNDVPAEEAGGAEERDNGNGSLMRILPVALRYTAAPIEEMLAKAHRISAVTHRHPRSQMACGLYCCMARGLLQGLAPKESYQFMIEHGERFYSASSFAPEMGHFTRILNGSIPALPEEAITSGGYVVHTLEASLWSLLTTAGFENAVLTAVNLGEDTDTTGCVTGGLAGLYYSSLAIPPAWITALSRRDEILLLLEQFVSTIANGQTNA